MRANPCSQVWKSHVKTSDQESAGCCSCRWISLGFGMRCWTIQSSFLAWLWSAIDFRRKKNLCKGEEKKNTVLLKFNISFYCTRIMNNQIALQNWGWNILIAAVWVTFTNSSSSVISCPTSAELQTKRTTEVKFLPKESLISDSSYHTIVCSTVNFSILFSKKTWWCRVTAGLCSWLGGVGIWVGTRYSDVTTRLRLRWPWLQMTTQDGSFIIYSCRKRQNVCDLPHRNVCDISSLC